MGYGKRKVEIKRIDNERSRMVTFSKRRKGLFKKANEYAVGTGSFVAVLVFSPAGKPFVYGSPSFDAAVESYLNGFQETTKNGENDMLESFMGLEEKIKSSAIVEELMEVKTVLEEARESVMKRLGNIADDKFVESLLSC